MSSPTATANRPTLGQISTWIVLAALGIWLAVKLGPSLIPSEFRPHAPDFSLLAVAPPAIQIHVAAALTALVIGTVLLLGVKGNTLHRALGWTWVVAMGTTAVSSFFIQQLNPGGFSFIHLLSGWTVIGLPMAVYAARRHRVHIHRRAMTGMFVGGLIVAGLLTFLPDRLMWEIFLG